MQNSITIYRPSMQLDRTSAYVWLGVLEILSRVLIIQNSRILSLFVEALQWALLAFCFYIFVKKKYSGIIMVTSIAIIGVLSLCYYNSGMSSFLKYFVVIISARDIYHEKLLKKVIWSYGIVVGMVFMLGVLGIIPSAIVRRGYSTYGFVHTNTLALYIVSIICCYISLYFDKLNFKKIVGLFIALVMLQLLTDSRTSSISILLALLLTVVFKRYGKKLKDSKLFKTTLIVIIPLFSLVSYWIGMNYNPANQTFATLNEWMSNRIYMANHFMQVLNISAMGQKVTIALVENSYLIAMYNYGIIPLAIMSVIYVYGMFNALKCERYGVLASMICFLLHGLAEGSAFELFVNIALITAFCNYESIDEEIIGDDKHFYPNV